ncbi:MAG: hypothetical protein K9K86_06395 [Pseudomonadales bacterium]|nr:hypothetical protein [Pseudomonadales bacterium]
MPKQKKEPSSRVMVWLHRRGENQKQNFLLLIIGAGTFFFGAGIIIWADNSIAPSVEQEIIALAGTLLSLTGVLTALLGYLGLSLFRLIKFFHTD